MLKIVTAQKTECVHKTRGILLSHTYSAIFHTLFYQSVEVLKCQDMSQKNRPAVTRFGTRECQISKSLKLL